MRPQVLFEETRDPNCQIGAGELVQPRRLVDLSAARSVSKVELLLKSALVGNCCHQFEEAFGVGDHSLTHCYCVESALVIRQANLA